MTKRITPLPGRIRLQDGILQQECLVEQWALGSPEASKQWLDCPIPTPSEVPGLVSGEMVTP